MSTGSRPTPAVLGLLVATVFWGCSFTWVKAGGDGINAALPVAGDSIHGPMLFLGLRFLLAATLWALVSPRAWRGWSAASVRRGLLLGTVLWVPMAFQVAGLDRTSEAVSAFLTSLTVVFVPLLLTVVLRRPPRGIMWGAAGVAAAGIWLMTGATPSGFGPGELLGLLCGVAFSVHILALDAVMKRETTPRMALAQFVVVGVGSLLVVAALPGGASTLAPSTLGRVLLHGTETIQLTPRGLIGSEAVWLDLLLVTLLSTLVAFGLVFALQPRVSPTRAAILYLAEPVFASAFAFLAMGRTLTAGALVGAGLILVANAIAEASSRRGA